MKKEQLDEVLFCLGQDKRILHFAKDGYATFLMDHFLSKKGQCHVRDIKTSHLGKLLDKPNLKKLVAKQPVLTRECLMETYAEQPEPLVITLGQWGGENRYGGYQTSRRGYNLVLKVNLSQRWDHWFHRYFHETANQFVDCGHPIERNRSATLGWVRLDMDFTTNEVLIEEVQSDLVRFMRAFKNKALQAKEDQCESFWFRHQTFNTEFVLSEVRAFKEDVLVHWQEALLWAALRFCVNDLGVDNVYYHSFETGVFLKEIVSTKPPRSIYVDLPKKFCLQETGDVPAFLRKDRRTARRLKKHNDAAFFKMAV